METIWDLNIGFLRYFVDNGGFQLVVDGFTEYIADYGAQHFVLVWCLVYGGDYPVDL